MILGIGVDVLEIGRMARRIEGDPGFARTFARAGEIEAVGPAAGLAAHAALVFAVKEAVLKVLGVGDADGLLFGDIELVTGGGSVAVRLHEGAASAARARGIETIHVSLSTAEGAALAVAVAEGGVTREESA